MIEIMTDGIEGGKKKLEKNPEAKQIRSKTTLQKSLRLKIGRKTLRTPTLRNN